MKIVYPLEWDEFQSFEIKSKDWLSGVIVELDDGTSHDVTFYDPARLAQDLESEIAEGGPGIIEKGLIVVSEVTKQNIEKVIAQAIERNFFNPD